MTSNRVTRNIGRTIAAVLTSSICCAGVQPQWVKAWRGGQTLETNQVNGLFLDQRGNAVIGGSATTAAGDFDYIVLKYAPSGNLLWSSHYGTTNNGNDQVRGMAVDQNGNVYVTGTSMTVKYGPAGNQLWAMPFAGRAVAVNADGFCYVTGFSEVDFATAKFNSAGSNLWTRIADVYGLREHSERITMDSEGNLYVAGSGQSMCAGVTCAWKFVVVKYDCNGNVAWTSDFPDPPYLLAFATIDSTIELSGSIYITAKSDSSGFYTTSLRAENGATDWTQDFGLSNFEGVSGLAVNRSGDTYLTGGRVLNQIPNITFVTFKVDPSGKEAWRAYYSNNTTEGFHRADAMTIDTAGSIFVTGQSGESPDSVDWATLKYSPDGTQQWVQRYDGPAHGADRARAIAVDAAGNVYVAGTQTATNGSTEIVLIKYVEVTSIRLEAGGNVRLNFLGSPGQTCRFQASAELSEWADIGSGVVDASGVATYLDTNTVGFPTRFYRMVSP